MTMFVYYLRDPIDGDVYYVGKTNNPKARLYQHINCQSEYFLSNWICYLRHMGLEPVMDIVYSGNPDSEWVEEKRHIEHGLRSGWPLLNNNGVPKSSERERFKSGLLRKWRRIARSGDVLLPIAIEPLNQKIGKIA